jgi:hypothetical protein
MYPISTRFLSVLILAELLAGAARASNEPAPAGARAVGLANATATVADSWALTNNIGGLGWLTQTSVAVYVNDRFGVGAFRTTALAVAAPMRQGQGGVAGLDVARFGDEIYSEARAGVGYAYRQGPFSLGVKADLLQISTQGLVSRRAVALSVGGVVQLLPKLWLGAYGYNLNQVKLVKELDERLPTQLKAGLSYRPGSRVMINLETHKAVDQPAAVVAGIEYQPHPVVTVRTGFDASTLAFSFGAGGQARGFRLDYALDSHRWLGLSHHVGLSYTFGGAKAGEPTPGAAK